MSTLRNRSGSVNVRAFVIGRFRRSFGRAGSGRLADGRRLCPHRAGEFVRLSVLGVTAFRYDFVFERVADTVVQDLEVPTTENKMN